MDDATPARVPDERAPDLARVLTALGLASADVVGMVRVAGALMGAVARADLTGAPPAVITALPELIERNSRVVEAARANSLSALEADGTWALDAQRTARAWYAQRAGLTPAQAGRHLTRARLLRDHLPEFARALADGQVPVAAVDTVGSMLADSPARVGALSAPNLGEDFLVRCAADLAATDFRTLAAQWAVRVDPEAAERAWREECERQELSLDRTTGGWHLRGWLSHEAGLTLRTALDALIGRPAAEDTRSRGRRNADAMHALARHLLDSGEAMPAARIRPHLTVHVPEDTARAVAAAIAAAPAGGVDPAMAAFADDFLAGDVAATPDGDSLLDVVESAIPALPDLRALAGLVPATFADGTPLAPGQLARHLCDATLTRYVYSGAGEPLNVGPARRLFSARQVKAITARDRHCQFTGCTAPPSWCEAHHAIPWETSRRTDVPNGILLCWTHHQQVHQHRLTITRHADRWEFHHPDGRVHSVVPRGAAHPAHRPRERTPA